MSKALVELIRNKFPDAFVETHSQVGDDTVVVKSDAWHEICAFLKSSPDSDIDMLIDLTAVDFPEREPRFEVVAHMYSLGLGHRLRLKTRVGDAKGENTNVATLSDLWGSANWMEREAWDMFGIVFDGHPDLRRILMYPEFKGHPLRRDYPADKIQPLVEYRKVDNIDKLPPFDANEGMSFGRQTHDNTEEETADAELFGDN